MAQHGDLTLISIARHLEWNRPRAKGLQVAILERCWQKGASAKSPNIACGMCRPRRNSMKSGKRGFRESGEHVWRDPDLFRGQRGSPAISESNATKADNANPGNGDGPRKCR